MRLHLQFLRHCLQRQDGSSPQTIPPPLSRIKKREIYQYV